MPQAQPRAEGEPLQGEEARKACLSSRLFHGRMALPRPYFLPADTSLGFWPPELGDNTLLLFQVATLVRTGCESPRNQHRMAAHR